MSTARVDFTRGAAERIARAVRIVETGERDQQPLRFDKLDLDSPAKPIRIGTFNPPWPLNELKVVTYSSSTATVMVRNVSLPLDMDDQSPNTAVRRVLFSRVAGEPHAVEIEQTGICGKYRQYLVRLNVVGCHGEGAQAIVRTVDIGTAAEPAANSGTGPIDTLEIVNAGSGYALRGREEPQVGITARSTNLSFAISYLQTADLCSIPFWRISGVTVSGPTAEQTQQTLRVRPLTTATIAEVAADIEMNESGITINEAGKYYRESNSLNPYTQTVTINISQLSPSSGTDAQFSAVIGTNPANSNFGRVTSINIDDGGTAYMAWQWQGSTPVGNEDWGLLPGYKAYTQQVLSHDNGCLEWLDVVECPEEEEE